MRGMATEQFYEGLIGQYRELIFEAVLESESEHRTQLNIGKLNSKLQMIMKAARYDGIPDQVISDLIEQTVPMAHAA